MEGAQKFNSESPYDPAIPLLGVYLTTWFHCVLTATTTGAVALGKLLTFSGPRSPIYKMGIIIASADQAVRRIQCQSAHDMLAPCWLTVGAVIMF